MQALLTPQTIFFFHYSRTFTQFFCTAPLRPHGFLPSPWQHLAFLCTVCPHLHSIRNTSSFCFANKRRNFNFKLHLISASSSYYLAIVQTRLFRYRVMGLLEPIQWRPGQVTTFTHIHTWGAINPWTNWEHGNRKVPAWWSGHFPKRWRWFESRLAHGAPCNLFSRSIKVQRHTRRCTCDSFWLSSWKLVAICRRAKESNRLICHWFNQIWSSRQEVFKVKRQLFSPNFAWFSK